MKLTHRFLLANIVSILIPTLITFFVGLTVFYLYSKGLERDVSLEQFQQVSQLRYELAGSNQGMLRQNPDLLEQDSFHAYLQGQLSSLHGEAILIKNERVLFTTRNFSPIDIQKSLEIATKAGPRQRLTIDSTTFSVDPISLALSDGSQGKVILLLPVLAEETLLQRFLLILAGIFLVSFLLTALVLSRRLRQTIIIPLQNLQDAATEIQNGNLDRLISEEGDQEIQELCRDLENLRIRLKDSIHTQLKYEENRKMLVSSISHDLKTPVTSIKGYVEGILDGVANTPEKTERYLKTIYEKARQVDQMIDDLLLYAKLDVNQLPFYLQDIDMEEYLRRFLLDFEPELEQQGIQLIRHFEIQSPQRIPIDQEKMGRVLTNILNNACKYMDKDPGTIQFFLRETPSSLVIEIQDNGSGIPAADLPHIFDRFYRADPSRTSEIKGSGLGLAIAKQIVEGHGGKIWVKSHPSEGTSLYLSLPKFR